MHGCSVTQKYHRKRQRRQFKIWDKTEEFCKELSSGILESNYFAWISPVIYGSLSKQKSLWQCSSRLTGYRLKPIQLPKRWFLPPHSLSFHIISSKWLRADDWDLAQSGHISCLVNCSVHPQSSIDLVKVFILRWENKSFEGNIVTGSETLQCKVKNSCFALLSALGLFYWKWCLLHVTSSGVIWVLSVTAAGKEGHSQSFQGAGVPRRRFMGNSCPAG